MKVEYHLFWGRVSGFSIECYWNVQFFLIFLRVNLLSKYNKIIWFNLAPSTYFCHERKAKFSQNCVGDKFFKHVSLIDSFLTKHFLFEKNPVSSSHPDVFLQIPLKQPRTGILQKENMYFNKKQIQCVRFFRSVFSEITFRQLLF